MKKKLEAELISIAHRVLKLKGKEDVRQLYREAQLLYEQLSILNFYFTHIDSINAELSEEFFENKLNQYNDISAKDKVDINPKDSEADFSEQELELHAADQEVFGSEGAELSLITEKISVSAHEEGSVKDIKKNSKDVAGESSIIKTAFELEPEELEPLKKKSTNQISLDDFLNEEYREPEFIKIDDDKFKTKEVTQTALEIKEVFTLEDQKVSLTQTETFIQKTENKPLSLNDTLARGIHVGLNDRIAFVKHLFNGSNEDYNRVLSQLNSFHTLEEAQEFVENIVKPDYNNWENKEDFAQRFMNLVEKKFV